MCDIITTNIAVIYCTHYAPVCNLSIYERDNCISVL